MYDTENDTISSPQFWSEPSGIAFNEITLNGSVVTVKISGMARGQTYRIRHGVTIDGTGEFIELKTAGEHGIPIQCVGAGRAGEDYSGSHRFLYG